MEIFASSCLNEGRGEATMRVPSCCQFLTLGFFSRDVEHCIGSTPIFWDKSLERIIAAIYLFQRDCLKVVVGNASDFNPTTNSSLDDIINEYIYYRNIFLQDVQRSHIVHFEGTSPLYSCDRTVPHANEKYASLP